MSDIQQILNDLTNAANDIFEVVAWAEDEIAYSMNEHPHKSDLLFGTFLTLRPHFQFCSEKQYRAHCHELLERVAHNEDVKQPTRAEMLELLSRVSAFIPFHSHAGALYRLIFEEVYPGVLGRATDDIETLNERFPGETDGLREEIRHELFKITQQRTAPRIDTRWRERYIENEPTQLSMFGEATHGS